MDSKTEIKEVTFDLVSCLVLIGSDESLMSMFSQKFGNDINMAITKAKQGVKSESDAFVKGMFDNVIMTNRYKQQYVSLYSGNVPEDKVIEIKPTKLPRRLGKEQIMSQITEQGGKPTECQRMLLKVNDLKNIVARLNRLGKAEYFSEEDGKILTDKQCREINGVIQTVENKLKKIL